MKSIVLSVFFLIASAAMAHTPVEKETRPAPITAEEKHPRGYPLYVTGQSYHSAADSLDMARKRAAWMTSSSCLSGKSRQISAWETRYHDFDMPAKCVEVEGARLCEENRDFSVYFASADFECL